MITMNWKTRTAYRFRGVVAGIVAAVMMFGLADLIARAFTPSAAPLLTLGQAIIPLAPPAAIKPVIALFGDNDKLVLVLSTGLGAIVLAGLIGALAVSHRRLATTLLVVAGLVPAIVIILRSEAGAIDVIPTLIGIAVGVAVFVVLLRLGVPATLAEATNSPGVARGSRTTEPLSRRRFFGLAGAIGDIGAVTIAAGQTVVSLTQDAGAAIAKLVLPTPAKKAAAIPAAASTDVDGTVPFVTEAKDFYRIDTVLSPPVIDPEQWSLRIHGMVENEVTLTMDDVLDLPLEEHHITLTCVSNPVGGDLVGNATWLGYPVRELLARARPSSQADMVLSHSFDGFTASTPIGALTDDRAALLAVGMNGEPLTPIHGFPARLVVPGLYGFVSATKWVTELEVTRFDEKTAYWTDRGWDAKAPILVASRIEVPGPLAKVSAGDIRVGGTAWAQRSGIERVEVKLDDGEWTRAELAEEVTIDTWRQWRAEFAEVAAGSHTLTVRATDKDGTVQTAKRRDSIPNSATGHHHIQFRVE
ncbi:DMSO/TMAO reductase YedYZ, molybdopterin-dependent catalytic subunit [Brevibacterium iodinum ATCC 49514]|uniref:DMSO/TMAO reductase YedYZ, molybdopterin-dependent catalytic subunit n=2 Tax=Brevibacterium iodinum TaxID=31943 RepID=A0A2H1KB15_9MICO|nr:DMSO/TMAO reductase YedYZ, molybdopterin-dependent catalytic subunit [Brevibacterium iodinum ATCC 49514]SUW13995.1 Sulfoxide reductase catalytic subunit yedY precursor [Brevibacterium iodinum]